MRRSHDRTRAISNRNGESDMEPIKLHARTGPRSAYPFARSNPKRAAKSSISIVVFIATISVLFFCCYVLFTGKRSEDDYSLRYRVVIDGGSTGTRIHVFEFRVVGGRPILNFSEDGHASHRVNPGLSAYAKDPDGVDGSIAELLEFVKGKVPQEMWRDTEIRLMATAGMRLLEPVVQEKILKSCKRVLMSSGFKFRDEWASIISGSDEGVYAWAVANYALGTLGGDPLETAGIIELGGASAQVTFVSSEHMAPELSRSITFGNFTYHLYSHSFLSLGQNIAFESLRESLMTVDLNSADEPLQKEVYVDPCTPQGFSINMNSLKHSPDILAKNIKSLASIQAGGNFSKCRSAALTLLQQGKENCAYQHCYLGSTFMPKFRGRLLATENFFHTSKFFGLGRKAILSDFLMAGEQFCGLDLSRLKMKYPLIQEEDLLPYCFSSAYIVALLHDSLGISLNDERIGFANEVAGIPLDWPLGAFILQSFSDTDEHHGYWIHTIFSHESSTLLYVIGIAAVLTLVTLYISKCRKPQLKTVYDLENGRYIITRARTREIHGVRKTDISL